ncbi:hypothetical protein OG234_13585 [Streptomyces sp. NBC_01420]|uniref:hypothetical protein n=1 Tax=Streptomyces sp. NBC_01420 TaxID=2903858 RepID=UPI00325165CE
MPTDEEITAALDAAVSNLSVARALGCSPSRVRRVRVRAGVPSYRRGRPRAAASWAELYERLTVAVDGGHRHWSGPVTVSGTAILRLDGRNRTAARYAFEVVHGREAEGHVSPGCEYPGCVAGEHIRDRAMREGRS